MPCDHRKIARIDIGSSESYSMVGCLHRFDKSSLSTDSILHGNHQLCERCQQGRGCHPCSANISTVRSDCSRCRRIIRLEGEYLRTVEGEHRCTDHQEERTGDYFFGKFELLQDTMHVRSLGSVERFGSRSGSWSKPMPNTDLCRC